MLLKMQPSLDQRLNDRQPLLKCQRSSNWAILGIDKIFAFQLFALCYSFSAFTKEEHSFVFKWLQLPLMPVTEISKAKVQSKTNEPDWGCLAWMFQKPRMEWSLRVTVWDPRSRRQRYTAASSIRNSSGYGTVRIPVRMTQQHLCHPMHNQTRGRGMII
jgi:hypothetical protein